MIKLKRGVEDLILRLGFIYLQKLKSIVTNEFQNNQEKLIPLQQIQKPYNFNLNFKNDDEIFITIFFKNSSLQNSLVQQSFFFST